MSVVKQQNHLNHVRIVHLVYLRSWPFVFFPPFYDSVSSAAGSFNKTYERKHFLKGEISADAFPSFEELVYGYEHCSRVRENKPVRITFYDDVIHHAVSGMNETIYNCFTERFMCGCKINPYYIFKLERNRKRLPDLRVDSVEKLEKVRFPIAVQIDSVSPS